MLRIQLREWEWMDLMFSLTCSTKLCTGALFIHQTRACSSNPLTKKFRINWQHQSGKQTDNFLPPVRDANNIQYGRKEELSVFYVSSPRFLCQKNQLLCGVFNLSTPGSPRLRQEYADLNECSIVSSDWGGKWRIVNDNWGLLQLSILPLIWRQKGNGSAARLTQQKNPFEVGDTHHPSTFCSYNSPLVRS